MFIGIAINRSLSDKLFGNYWKDRSDVASVDWIKIWHVINHLLSHFRLQSSNTPHFVFAGALLLVSSSCCSRSHTRRQNYCSCRKLRQAFSASSHVFKKGKRNYSMKCLDFQLVNYFRFQQLDVHDARTRRNKIVRFSLQLPTGWTWTKHQLFLYMVFQKTEPFPHHFTVKSEVLQEYFRMIRLFPISLDCRISNKGLFGCCKRWSFAVGKRNERYQVSPKMEKISVE